MDLAPVTAELTDDPLGRGYSGMTDAEALADLYTAYITQTRSSMSASEVLNAVDVPEFNALDADAQRRIWDVLHCGSVNPSGVEATIFTAAFGAGSATIIALVAARTELITRAAELGLSALRVGDIQKARA